jgi:hypothetical protein
MRDTDLVFSDLRAALATLESARGTPREVRRALSRFVELTQRLTSTMRRDYSRVKGERWDAGSFPGWNHVTELFKWYRNEEQHGDQIYIAVRERHMYSMDSDSNSYIVSEGTWNLNDQNAEKPPSGLALHAADPVTGQMTDEVLVPARVEHTYLFRARSEEAAARLRLAAMSDVHRLSQSCFETLSQYHAFFGDRIQR